MAMADLARALEVAAGLALFGIFSYYSNKAKIINV